MAGLRPQMAVVPWNLQVPDWAVRRGWPDRLSAAGLVSGSTGPAGLSRSRQHHNDLTVRAEYAGARPPSRGRGAVGTL
jgi:hypothetical protein